MSGRSPGTHVLHMIEGADHNFAGVCHIRPLSSTYGTLTNEIQHFDEVVDTILAWWTEKEKGTLKDGIWGAGIGPGSKGRL